MEGTRKRKHSGGVISEERLFKKFEALESKLMELWATESNREDENDTLEPLDSGVTDIVSFVDVQLDNSDNLDDEDYFEDAGNLIEDEEPIQEIPYRRPTIEEVDLTDDELPNTCDEFPRPVEESQEDQDVVFLCEETPDTKESEEPEEPKQPEERFLNSSGEFPLHTSGEFSLHPDIKETWKKWTRCGIPFKDKRELLNKYSPPKVLKTPEVNEEILVTLHKRPIDKDEHSRTSQDLLSSALTALGTTMTTLLVENDGIDRLKVMNGLNDTAKLLTELFHFETDKRRSQIISWKTKPLRGVLADTKPDEFLFGSDLKSKIHQAQQSGIIGPLKPYVYKKRYNNQPRRSFASPYYWYGREEVEEEEEQNFVLNPMKQETKFVCKKEDFPIKLE